MVDDDREFLFEIETALGNNGFVVKTQFVSALAVKNIIRYNPDLVILDMDMPGMSGLQVLNSLRKTSIGLETPVILLTGNGSQDIMESGFRQGLDDYLTKPVRLTELILRINAILKRCGKQKNIFPIRLQNNDIAKLENQPVEGLMLWVPGCDQLDNSDLKSFANYLTLLIVKLSHRFRDTITNNHACNCKVYWLAGDLVYFNLKLDLNKINQKKLVRDLYLFRRYWKWILPVDKKETMLIIQNNHPVKSSVPDFYIRMIRTEQCRDISRLKRDLKLALSFEQPGVDMALVVI